MNWIETWDTDKQAQLRCKTTLHWHFPTVFLVSYKKKHTRAKKYKMQKKLFKVNLLITDSCYLKTVGIVIEPKSAILVSILPNKQLLGLLLDRMLNWTRFDITKISHKS